VSCGTSAEVGLGDIISRLVILFEALFGLKRLHIIRLGAQINQQQQQQKKAGEETGNH
jgi:hypothetical protein